ncbi:hypothetical protein M2G46_22035 [Vibrio vulnificus]|nr:hypothetical protein [Vibrio vulnificus]
MSAEKELKPENKEEQVTNDAVEEPTETQLTEVQELLNQLPQEMLVDALIERNEGLGGKNSIQFEQAISQQYSGPLPPQACLRDTIGFSMVSLNELFQWLNENKHTGIN